MKKGFGLLVKISFFVILLLAVGSAGYFYYQYQAISKKGVSEVKQLVETISQFMELPEETPTLATVTDKTRLEKQLFFQKAQNGDKVLIFPQAQKAILYRPSTQKIIEVASVRTADNDLTSSQETSPSAKELDAVQAPISVVLYNGTAIEGVTLAFQQKLTTKFSNFEVVAKGYAAKRDYQKTLVIDISGENPDLVSNITSEFGAKISTLPEEEASPASQLLIIVGQDQQ